MGGGYILEDGFKNAVSYDDALIQFRVPSQQRGSRAFTNEKQANRNSCSETSVLFGLAAAARMPDTPRYNQLHPAYRYRQSTSVCKEYIAARDFPQWGQVRPQSRALKAHHMLSSQLSWAIPAC